MEASAIRIPAFEKVGSPIQIRRYLQGVLSRPSTTKETTYLYRYTKINWLVDMLNSRYMRLGPCATMNDDFETAVLERHGMLEKLFYACFTKADESLAMYKLYGIDHDSVIFRISYADLEKFMNEVVVNTDADKHAPIHSFMLLHNNKPTNRRIQGQLYCSAVGYVDPVTNGIKTGLKINYNITAPFNHPELAGKVKYRCWEYEDEVRLCGELSADVGENECIAVRVPDSFDSMISVTLCPGFDMVKNRTFLIELGMRGIRYNQSVYDPIYTAFLEKKDVRTYQGENTVKQSFVENETLHLAK